MERLPLFISIGSFLAWALVALLADRPMKTAARGVGLGLAAAQLGGAIWAAARIFGDTTGVHYRGVWFSVGPAKETFEVVLAVDSVAAVFWLALSVFAAVLAYFSFLNQLSGDYSQQRGEAATAPLIGVGALMVLASGNILTFYFGWAFVSAVGFLAVAFSAPKDEARAAASMRYFVLSILPEVIFLAGILGCYTLLGTLNFSEINDKIADGGEQWVILCLVLGMMLRNLQIPFMQCASYVATARTAATPVFFLGNALLSSALFAKIYPAISATEGMQYFAIVPALTAIAAAVLALPEEDQFTLIGWVVSYVCASVFLSGLTGDYQAAHALALAGAIGTFLLTLALSELAIDDRSSRWFIGIAVIVMAGLPIGGWGWARYLEYLGLIHNEGQIPSFHWLLLGLKIFADILMGLALWRVVCERRAARKASIKPKWQVIIPLSVLAMTCVSTVIGGRPFGGLTGQFPSEASAAFTWFERLIGLPATKGKTQALALELVGSDSDIIARLIVVGVLVIPLLIGFFWLFRDKKSADEFRAFCRRFLRRLSFVQGRDSKFWSWVIRPISSNLGRLAAIADLKVLDYAVADMWARPARLVRDAFKVIEDAILDRQIIDGLASAVASIGKSLRLVQNGQVQFYFALGLILMGAIVVKFVVVGG